MLYYYPNRPILVPPDPKDPLKPQPDYINGLEASGKFVAEQKWNGDNTLIYTDDLTLWNRHHDKLKTYHPSPEAIEELKKFPKGSIINAEVVNSKTKTIKDLIVVHCIMAWDGELLLGKTWGDSRKILESLGLPLTNAGQTAYTNHVLLSRTWTSGFWNLFQQADVTNIEGIILKDPKGKLQFSTTPLADVSWMLKIRKPCKKYSF